MYSSSSRPNATISPPSEGRGIPARILTRRLAAIAAGVLLVLTTAAPANANARGHQIDIEVLSSQADQVSGGDALIQVQYGPRIDPADLVVKVNGNRVTLTPGKGTLTGVVTGLHNGYNLVTASAGWLHTRMKVLKNHPITGPIFSGPKQYPFLCRTEQNGLGAPLVDNQDGEGWRLPDGWSRDCSANTVVDRVYRATNGQFKPMTAERPADMTTTTTLDGKTVDYVVKRERGTINRFLYSIAMLEEAWNQRVIYHFDGGVGIGHDQGGLPGRMLYHDGLKLGYAILFSTGTRTSVHYNLELGGETALMLKEHFIEAYGVPKYTVGLGGSGGGLQQYIYGQNYGNRVIDGAVAQYAYPDMVTQTIHVGDCELLEYYMDVTDAANPKWKDWTKRSQLIGLNGSNTLKADECIRGWRGLTPLAFNPLWTPLDPLWARMDPPGVAATVKWTHADDLRTIYGVDEDGYALRTWDNVGIQYGLNSLRSGAITKAEFLDVNEKVGGWKPAKDMVQEGCPFVPTLCSDPAQFDPWSSRNRQADRSVGSPKAIERIEDSGLVFTGDIDIPVIDWRHYLEEKLDMHNSRQSFVSRQRMLEHDGNASNQVIWFTDARPAVAFDQTPQALAAMEIWLTTGSKPVQDACFSTTGAQIATGASVWSPGGACDVVFPRYETSRTVAGAPVTGDVFACRTQSVRTAIARGVYGPITWSDEEAARLAQIFPQGVCRF